MAEIAWTCPQKAAIETVGCSVLVSAGAGSGKTAVLAERCARLLADPNGCDADQLLVVTFTDAAATQMRDRIGEALRKRSAGAPSNLRLQRQLALLEGAWVSTIHSFCRRVLNRFFAQSDVDPDAPILDAHDAMLLRRETAKRVFDDLAAREDERDRAGSVKAGEAFLSLLDAYGGASEKRLQGLALQMAEFLNSLPDPADWIADARLRFAEAAPNHLPDFWLERLRAALCGELEEQIETVKRQIERWRRNDIDSGFLEFSAAYAHALGGWLSAIKSDTAAEALNRVCVEGIASYDFPSIPAKRGKGYQQLDDAAKAAFAEAQEQAKSIRDDLFAKRLKGIFGGFSVSGWAEGVHRTRPHVETFLSLLESLRAEYQAAKADLGVLDFSDLECKTLALLRDESNGVARRLRNRFKFVMVDEFQDVNRVQAEILRLVSREADESQANNLFAVGDVKQSIYRFRLAEPRLFLKREADATREIDKAVAESSGCAIDLVENFRSTRGVIDTVNAVFERIMARDFGDIDYDDHARLKCGRADDAAEPWPAMVLHVFESPKAGGSDDEDTQGDALDWERIEREAYVIAREIHALVEQGRRYAEMVILLRSMQAHVGLLVRSLSQLGIPVFADAGGSLFESLEIMDVLSLLRLLDNEQQDIPLASVLRSPLLGEPLSYDQLVEVRTRFGADLPFHAAVAQYATDGSDAELKNQLAAVFRRLRDWRRIARRRPIADVLWQIYEESGYLSHVQGLPSGLQRRANLLQLHEYARTFGGFQRQGLLRFLQFIDGLRDAGEDLEPGSAAAPAGDVVRVMTIHRAKGLEFPIVIVGELGKRFNLQDAQGSILYDRELGLGLEAVDLERRIIYPTLPHRLVAEALKTESLAEELRVLYVALTRAKERLILVGTGKLLEPAAGDAATPGPLLRLERAGARSMLDWISKAIAALPVGGVAWRGEETIGREALIGVRQHAGDEMRDWKIEVEPPRQTADRLRAIAGFQELRPTGATAEFAPLVEKVARRLTTRYPASALTRVPAVAAASALKGRWGEIADEEDPVAEMDWAPIGKRAATQPIGSSLRGFRMPQFLDATGKPEPTSLGTWTHDFLQRIELNGPCDAVDLRRQVQGFVKAGAWSEEQARLMDVEAVSWFFDTELGRALRNSKTRVLREWPFVLGVDPKRYEPDASAQGTEDVMLVRGIIDVLFDEGNGWQVLDYKTDRVEGTALRERADHYAGQLQIYAAAVEAAWRARPKRCWLVFLAAREIVAV